MPAEKTPDPDGFTVLFYHTAWLVDMLQAMAALWDRDFRSLYLVTQAYMILLRKKSARRRRSEGLSADFIDAWLQ
jgi:hypothetical protein